MVQHWSFPYPGPTSLAELSEKTGLTGEQLENWFRNERRRRWRPYMTDNYPEALKYAERIRGTRPEGGMPSLRREHLDFYVEAAFIAFTRRNQKQAPNKGVTRCASIKRSLESENHPSLRVKAQRPANSQPHNECPR
eukprot:gb/GECG01008882.1/.p1 GENE.gb/GECG01008882.1/~~gb/GECG01008882.1/.p1  ORF type:complete len:137 (+),score=9.75 gb/GECG01008882.1/:1-411(+)